MNIDILKDNTIVICPKTEAKRLIAFRSLKAPELNIKFLDKKELLEDVYFTFGLDAIDYVSRTYGYSLENAKEIILNSYNVSNLTKKTEMVKKIKKDLIDKNFLKTNPRFKRLFENKKILVSGYDEKDKELEHAFDLLNVVPSFIKDKNKNIEREVISFENIDHEVLFVIERIYGLLEKGVDLNDIFIYRPDSEYIPLLKKYSSLYDLPIELNDAINLADSPLYSKFLALLDEHEVEEAYELLKQSETSDPYGAFPALSSSINACAFALPDKKRFKILLDFVAKGSKLRTESYDHSIKICESSFRSLENQYIFVFNFSLGSFPRVYLDNDFYSDEEKASLFINDSKTESEMEKKSIVDFLNGNQNICLTRKNKLDNTLYFESLLTEELGYVKQKGKLPSSIHSEKVSKILTSKAKDDLRLYNLDSEFVDSYPNEKLGYMSYDNSFAKSSSYSLPKNLRLSYSSINEFNKCPFSYYLKRILKLDTFESNFNANLGTLFHKVLEDSENGKEIDLSDYNDFIEENFLNEKERFFVSVLLPKSLDVIKKNKEFEKQSKFNRVETEKTYEIEIEPGIKLNGKIDKILYDEEWKNLIVVDYKTSQFSYKDEETRHGINMQLPIYAYLLRENIPEYKAAGLYIQNVLFDPLANPKSNRDRIPYILAGLTIKDTDIAKRIDTEVGSKTDSGGKTINDSAYVRNIGLNANGMLSTRAGTLIEDDDMAGKIELTKDLIKLTLNEIKEGNFFIRPLGQNDNESPCPFCDFRDICFRKSRDSLKIKSYYATVDEALAKMRKEEGEKDESR